LSLEVYIFAAMGAVQSVHATNDYELAIKSSKELEHILDVEFGAQGKGLHEKISSASNTSSLPQELVRNMRYLATIRNKLVHEHGFDRIPDRSKFIQKFEWSSKELKRIIEELRRSRGAKSSGGGACTIS
jgi:hypothetical protein